MWHCSQDQYFDAAVHLRGIMILIVPLGFSTFRNDIVNTENKEPKKTEIFIKYYLKHNETYSGTLRGCEAYMTVWGKLTLTTAILYKRN